MAATVAQLAGVGQTDRGNDRDQRPADISRVEPAAETDFQHDRIGLLADEFRTKAIAVMSSK